MTIESIATSKYYKDLGFSPTVLATTEITSFQDMEMLSDADHEFQAVGATRNGELLWVFGKGTRHKQIADAISTFNTRLKRGIRRISKQQTSLDNLQISDAFYQAQLQWDSTTLQITKGIMADDLTGDKEIDKKPISLLFSLIAPELIPASVPIYNLFTEPMYLYEAQSGKIVYAPKIT